LENACCETKSSYYKHVRELTLRAVGSANIELEPQQTRPKIFAKSLARVISRLEREKSTVLALTGIWGSGKISIKNLLTEELRSTQIHRVFRT
jgi:putative protein kinase ArgK-like GTPase of G3E family